MIRSRCLASGAKVVFVSCVFTRLIRVSLIQIQQMFNGFEFGVLH